MRREVLREPTIFVLHDFFSADECARHIARAEQLGFEAATLGDAVFKQVRDNARAIVDDAVLADALSVRARPYLVQEWFRWRLSGFNPRWRYYRYDVGQRFALHGDGAHRQSDREQSQFTFLIYLNGECEGGSTNFHLGKDRLRVQPAQGLALVFLHDHLHEGAEVTKGRKYVLRTDVMYRQEPVE